MTPTIRPLATTDREAWNQLYSGYAAFYRVEQTAQMRDRVWGWLMDPAHEVKGLIAVDATGAALGLAHFRPYARPLMAAMGGFLDDLFVDPAARGSGTARALIAALTDIGRARGWGVIRWITADDNYPARTLYDQVASKTQWATYDIKL